MVSRDSDCKVQISYVLLSLRKHTLWAQAYSRALGRVRYGKGSSEHDFQIDQRERGAHRVVGNIWCIGSCLVRYANSGNPRRLTSPSLAWWRQC